MDQLISFDDMKAGNKAIKKLVQAFTRAGTPVATADVDPKVKRSVGVNYRQVQITFVDNQTVTLGVKTTGDIFEVRVNGSVTPLKNQDDQVKAVAEISKMLDAGRAKFQQKLARQKVALPKGLQSTAKTMEAKLAEAKTSLDADIAAAQARIAELKAELGDGITLDSVAADEHASDLAAAKGGNKILKGVARHNASWKEGTFVAGDVVWVWDAKMPKPYSEWHYPKVGAENNYAHTDSFDFSPATAEEIAALKGDGATLDAVDVPLTTFEEPVVVEARNLLDAIAKGETMDSAGAIATLQAALDVVETNYPINLAEGNMGQALLEEKMGEELREAMKVLQAA